MKNFDRGQFNWKLTLMSPQSYNYAQKKCHNSPMYFSQRWRLKAADKE